MKLRYLFWTALISTLPLNAQQTARVQPSQTHDLVLRATNKSECPSKSIPPRVLADGRMLLSVVDTVYMVGANGKVEWKYTTRGPAQPLTLSSAPAFNPSTNEIGVIGCDLFFVRLDASDGSEKWRTRVNGSSEYTQLASYKNGFLLVLNSHGSNDLQFWGESDDDFLQVEFPNNAELVVAGEKIYAVRAGSRILHVKELHPHP